MVNGSVQLSPCWQLHQIVGYFNYLFTPTRFLYCKDLKIFGWGWLNQACHISSDVFLKDLEKKLMNMVIQVYMSHLLLLVAIILLISYSFFLNCDEENSTMHESSLVSWLVDDKNFIIFGTIKTFYNWIFEGDENRIVICVIALVSAYQFRSDTSVKSWLPKHGEHLLHYVQNRTSANMSRMCCLVSHIF